MQGCSSASFPAKANELNVLLGFYDEVSSGEGTFISFFKGRSIVSHGGLVVGRISECQLSCSGRGVGALKCKCSGWRRQYKHYPSIKAFITYFSCSDEIHAPLFVALERESAGILS